MRKHILSSLSLSPKSINCGSWSLSKSYKLQLKNSHNCVPINMKWNHSKFQGLHWRSKLNHYGEFHKGSNSSLASYQISDPSSILDKLMLDVAIAGSSVASNHISGSSCGSLSLGEALSE